MDYVKMINLSRFENVLPEGVTIQMKNLSSSIISFYEEKPKIVYLGVGITGFYVFNKTIGVYLKHRFFAWINNVCVSMKDERYEAYKKELFSDLANIESHVPELKAKKALKILELGVGAGSNFTYYPDGTHLIAVDPNPYFQSYFRNNLKMYPNIMSGDVIQCAGEDMSIIPNNSVDAVIVTLVLCSVQSIEDVLCHIKRILVPGGKFYFMEHIQEWADEHRFRKFFQSFLTKTGIWPFVFDGCQLNRYPIPLIENAGFSDVSYQKFYAPIDIKLFYVIKPHVKGIATK